MLYSNVETFIGCNSTYADASIVLFGAPFDSTTSYRPGARFGCKSIRSESIGLETYSPYQDRDLTDYRVFDFGDLELSFGNSQKTLNQVEAFTCDVLSDGKLPIMLGGEHLVSLGAVRATAAAFPDLHVVHFDAHADLRDDYLGEFLSHATVMRRVWDLLGDCKIYQFGIRSGDRSEFEFAPGHTFMHKFSLDGLEAAIAALSDKPIYFSLDLDILDPSILPGTGTPEAGGVDFNSLLAAIMELGRKCNIVACDITELAPIYDHSGASTSVACKILRELILALGR